MICSRNRQGRRSSPERGLAKPSARGRTAAGGCLTPRCQSRLLPWVVTYPGWIVVSPAIKRSSFFFLLFC